MTALRAQEVAFPGRLAPTDLEVAAGERVAVIGPNGAGKTSLLRALAGGDGTSGRVSIVGETLASAPPARRAKLLGYVPAGRDAIWPIRVRDAVADGGATAADVEHWLAVLDLAAWSDRAVSDISTGERARVFLARALAPGPPVTLADEPAANLDPRWRLRVADLLAREAERGMAVVMTMHDLDLALGWASRLVIVKAGQVVADDAPEALAGSGAIERVFGVRRFTGGWETV